MLIEEKDLGITKNFGGRYLSKFMMHVLGVNKINRRYKEVAHLRGTDVTTSYFANQQITYELSPTAVQNIPGKGGAVVIANHPTGALDGMLLIDVLGKIRPDVKFLGNFLLMRIQALEDYFFPVDPFHIESPANISGIKKAISHVKNGGLLVIFPAGEVSTWQKGFHKNEDCSWSKPAIRLIRKFEVPVIPVFLNGENSRKFHLVGKIHPILRTIRLPLELLNKKGRHFRVAIGSAIPVKRLKAIKDPQVLSNYLRASVYFLNQSRELLETDIFDEGGERIIPAPNVVNLLEELDRIREKHQLFRSGDYEGFFVRSAEIPHMMQEIGRQREITFREVGEGTLKSVDTDRYDRYYYQLFVWDNRHRSLLGAYRVGLGKEIMKEHGIEGFYTHTLFELSREMQPILGKSIEMGRSFVIREYQRKPVSLLLLWRGILQMLLTHREYRYLIGPVSISGEMTDASKWIIMNFIREFHTHKELSKKVKPRNGIRSLREADVSLLSGVGSIELIDRLVRDIEQEQFSIPILLKKYIQLNGKVLGFNVDPFFNQSLDGLILVDLKYIPQQSIDLVSKELSQEEIRNRFSVHDFGETTEDLSFWKSSLMKLSGAAKRNKNRM